MLEQALGEAYTPDVAAAWMLVFDVISTTMVTAMKELEAEEHEESTLRHRLLGDVLMF